MKLKFLILCNVIFYGQILLAQNNKINSENYYNYYETSNVPLTTNWLRRIEIAPIIIEELERYGFKYNHEYQLYKLENGQFIVLDVYNDKYNFGFIYKTTHYAEPKPSHRLDTSGITVYFSDYLGKPYYINNIQLPEGVYILYEDWYWYQYKIDKFENNEFVNREIIIDILRSDIQKILSKYKDLDKALEKSRWKDVLPNFQLTGEIFVDNWAKFIDGQKGIDEYIKRTIIYPEKALKKNIEGSIAVQFTVKETGEIGDVQIMNGGNELLEKEAIRVISEMPKWKPAMQKGKPISLKYVQVITFKL